MESSNKTTPIIVGTLAVASIIGAGAYVFATGQSNTTASTQGTTQSSQSSTPSQSQSNSSSSSTDNNSSANTNTNTTSAAYKDGTYTATSSYFVPHGGQNSIKVTVTVANNEITDVQTNNNYSDPESGYYVDSFASNISGAVKGDNLGDAYAGRVGGASLTSSAFMDALQTIQNEAKA